MIEKENLHQNSGSDSLVLYNRINKDNVNFQTKIFIENKHQYLTRIGTRYIHWHSNKN